MNTENILMLQDTLDILKQGSYEINGKHVQLKLSQTQMDEIHIFMHGDIASISEGKAASTGNSNNRTIVGCEATDSYSMAQQLTKNMNSFHTTNGKPVLVLNFANPVHPGGGVRKGSRAQEEDLCRKSSLLRSLESSHAARYYNYNSSLNTYMGSDAVMITPHVEIIKDEYGNLLPESIVVAVMTCAAPKLTNGMEGMDDAQYRAMMLRRITGMLNVAAHLGYEVLVLGAFGCGAFDNDAHEVSDLFAQAMRNFSFYGKTMDDCFRCIEFAVMDHSASQYNLNEFRRNFDNFNHAEKDIAVSITSASADEKKQSYVFFWKTDEVNGAFSNWYIAPFVIEGIQYCCVEQYMMSRKALLFHDLPIYDRIMQSADPYEMKALGRQVHNFRHNLWDACRREVVYNACYAKFTQNPSLKAMLLATGDCIMAESSPNDRVWGIAMYASAAAETDPAIWPGKNLLGNILMQLREELR